MPAFTNRLRYGSGQFDRRYGAMPLLAFGALLLWGTSIAGQEPMRVDVRLVNVAFSAFDSHGVPIETLTKNDVEVFEDTVPQRISFFARSADVPLTLGLVVDFSGSRINSPSSMSTT